MQDFPKVFPILPNAFPNGIPKSEKHTTKKNRPKPLQSLASRHFFKIRERGIVPHRKEDCTSQKVGFYLTGKKFF